jgi:hypothetical protein
MQMVSKLSPKGRRQPMVPVRYFLSNISGSFLLVCEVCFHTDYFKEEKDQGTFYFKI